MERKYRKKVLHILMNHFSLFLSFFLSLHEKETEEKEGRRKREKESNAFFHEGNFLNTNGEGMK